MIVLTELNNNINGQLTPGLKILMEEITSVFWVDLGYRLRNQGRVPLQDSRGRPTSHTVYCYTVTVVPGSISWFNARSLGHGFEYVQNSPKV